MEVRNANREFNTFSSPVRPIAWGLRPRTSTPEIGRTGRLQTLTKYPSAKPIVGTKHWMHGTWSMHIGTARQSVIPYGVFDVREFLQTRVAKSVTRAAGSYYSKHPYSAKLFGHTRGEPVEQLGGPN
jgi:hypothetical protein